MNSVHCVPRGFERTPRAVIVSQIESKPYAGLKASRAARSDLQAPFSRGPREAKSIESLRSCKQTACVGRLRALRGPPGRLRRDTLWHREHRHGVVLHRKSRQATDDVETVEPGTRKCVHRIAGTGCWCIRSESHTPGDTLACDEVSSPVAALCVCVCCGAEGPIGS